MTLLLIVDDDEDIRETYASVLRDEGYDVEEAENGLRALEVLRAGLRPALVLLDQAMPILDGRGFREAQLRAPEFALIPLLLMSAASSAEIQRELAPAGIVRKPIGLEALLAAIRSLL